MMIVSVMYNEQHQIVMRLPLLRKTRRPPEHPTISRAQTRVDPLDSLRKTLADQVLLIGQNGLERSPIIRAVPRPGLQSSHRAGGRSSCLACPRDKPGFHRFAAHRRRETSVCSLRLFASFVRLTLTNERPEFVDNHPLIVFLQGIDHALVGFSSQATRPGLRTHAEAIGAIAEAAAASQQVQGLALACRISALVEVLILELLAAAAAEQILRPGWLFAVFDYFVGEAVGAAYFAGYFAHIRKVCPAASHHSF